MSEYVDKHGKVTPVGPGMLELFRNERRRLGGKVLGKIIDPKTEGHVLYETVGDLDEPQVDASGSDVFLTVSEARRYAAMLTAAAGAAEVEPRRFESGDAVTYPDLPRHWCAVVSTYTELGFGILNVHEYRPGDKDSGRNRAFIHRKIDQVERVDDEEPEDAAA